VNNNIEKMLPQANQFMQQVTMVTQQNASMFSMMHFNMLNQLQQ